jgi:hypothetical protein
VNLGRRHKPVRRWHITDAAGQDSRAADHLLMPGNTGSGLWADAACRSEKTQAQLQRQKLAEAIRTRLPTQAVP